MSDMPSRPRSAGNTEPPDEDLETVTAYLAGTLSSSAMMTVEDRLTSDRAFRRKAQPLLDVWYHPDSFAAPGELSPAPRTAPLSTSQVEGGWQRFLADERARAQAMPGQRSEPSLEAAGTVAAIARWRSIGRVAAVAMLILGSLVGLAQGVSYVARAVGGATGRRTVGPTSAPDELASNPPSLIGTGPLEESARGVVLDPTTRLKIGPAAGASASSQPSVWRVDPVPFFDIGTATGAGPDRFTEINGVVRLQDGRVVVAEFAGNLKFFTATGQPLAILAHHRTGSGDVEPIANLLPYRGDSLLMITESGSDSRRGYYVVANVLDANGNLGRVVTITWGPTGKPPRGSCVMGLMSYPCRSEATSDLAGLQGVESDGSFIGRGSSVTELLGTPGFRIGNASFYHISAEGTPADSIATLPVVEIAEAAGEPLGYNLPLFRMEAPRADIQDHFMYWGDGTRFEVTVLDLSTPGATRVMRAAKEPQPAGDAERQQYIDRMVASTAPRGGPPARTARDLYASRAAKSVLPAFRSFLVDKLGNVWLANYRLTQPLRGIAPDTTDVPRWTVLGANGALVGEVVTPRALTIAAIGPDWVLGIWTDANGVQHVRMHRLIKG